MRPKLNGWHFADDMQKASSWMKTIEMPLYFPKGPIDSKWALVQVMAWYWLGIKPLPGPLMTQFTDTYTPGPNELKTKELYLPVGIKENNYYQTYNISCTKSQNLNVSRLTLQLSLRYLLKLGVESKMKM